MESKNKIELLAPAGDKEKLETALHFGADAVYFAGEKLWPSSNEFKLYKRRNGAGN